jgi:hypothetical protein
MGVADESYTRGLNRGDCSGSVHIDIGQREREKEGGRPVESQVELKAIVCFRKDTRNEFEE